MRKLVKKKIGERIEYVTVHHDETVDEQGNIVGAFDEIIEKVIPVYGNVYEDMTEDEILSLKNETSDNVEPTIEERVEAIESALLEIILGGM